MCVEYRPGDIRPKGFSRPFFAEGHEAGPGFVEVSVLDINVHAVKTRRIVSDEYALVLAGIEVPAKEGVSRLPVREKMVDPAGDGSFFFAGASAGRQISVVVEEDTAPECRVWISPGGGCKGFQNV